MAIARLARYEDLVQYLVEGNVPHREDQLQLSVEVPVLTPPLTGTVFVRWERHLPYVQIVHPFVQDVPDSRVAAVESAITHANELLAAPGLGYHHDHRFVYMRRCVPVYAEGLLATTFQKQVAAVLEIARDHVAALTTLALSPARS